MSNKDKIEKLLANVESALQSINTNEQWLKYISFASKFTSYSVTNQLLIYMQNPEASFVAGYRSWERKFNRHVKSGSKAIKILAPSFKKIEVIKEPNNPNEYYDAEAEKETRRVISGFRTVNIFDIQDTEPNDDTADSLIPVLVSGLKGSSEELIELYHDILSVVRKEHEVIEVDKTASKGSFDTITGRICIRSNLDPIAKIKTLCHEWSHAIHLATTEGAGMTRAQKEIVAESSSYICCMRMGINTEDYSFPYIQSWMQTPNDIKIVAEATQMVACTILNKLAESGGSAFTFLKED